MTANKKWFDADPTAVFSEGVEQHQRISDFEERSIAWLKDAFGDDVIHARADLDEEAYHIHAVIMPRVQVEMTRTDKKTGEKKVIATRQMLQPSKFDVIKEYEHAQDSVGDWFSEIGLDRGERRKEAYREAVAKGETPPAKRIHSKTRDWRRKKDLKLTKRERDLETRLAAVEEKAAEAEAIIEITEAVSQGAVDPVAQNAEGALAPVKGREQDEVFLRAQRHAQRSPKGASRIAKAFRRGWGAMFERARKEALARVNADFRAANKTLEEVRGLLAKIGGTLGADLSGNISKLPDLARRLKMTISAGNISYERSTESRKNKNNDNTDG
ncbi:hypothetical protein SAMN06273572_11520 [Monaibacterium marinum]|uniref:Plasmid recombination enzyme n=1 Tax=Pontivivens marinum TaxID=1690039 RepID=A0A2C9CWN1_9RHOB|nr:hypothetical protein SAMN06273572_11520 [Monaibacterium marinum]